MSRCSCFHVGTTSILEMDGWQHRAETRAPKLGWALSRRASGTAYS